MSYRRRAGRAIAIRAVLIFPLLGSAVAAWADVASNFNYAAVAAGNANPNSSIARAALMKAKEDAEATGRTDEVKKIDALLRMMDAQEAEAQMSQSQNASNAQKAKSSDGNGSQLPMLPQQQDKNQDKNQDKKDDSKNNPTQAPTAPATPQPQPSASPTQNGPAAKETPAVDDLSAQFAAFQKKQKQLKMDEEAKKAQQLAEGKDPASTMASSYTQIATLKDAQAAILAKSAQNQAAAETAKAPTTRRTTSLAQAIQGVNRPSANPRSPLGRAASFSGPPPRAVASSGASSGDGASYDEEAAGSEVVDLNQAASPKARPKTRPTRGLQTGPSPAASSDPPHDISTPIELRAALIPIQRRVLGPVPPSSK